MEPRILFEGDLLYEQIPARVGAAPILPIYTVWKTRLEAYFPDLLLQDEIEQELIPVAEQAALRDLSVHYWRVRCTPEQIWMPWLGKR